LANKKKSLEIWNKILTEGIDGIEQKNKKRGKIR